MKSFAVFTVLALVVACSSAGKDPLLEADGTLPGEDVVTTDLQVPDDVPRVNDDVAADAVAEDVGPVDLVGPQDASPLDIGLEEEILPMEDVLPVEEVMEEVTVVDIVPQGPTCGDVFKCGLQKGCGMTSDACWATCFGAADADELAAFQGISDCVAEFCEALPAGQQGDCLMEKCIGQVYECLGGKGTQDCLSSFKCMQSCGQDDGLCFFECIEETDEGSLELLLQMAGATEEEMFPLLIECTGGNGELNCGQTVGCIMGCEEGTPPDDPGEDPMMNCMIDCISQSSDQGAAQLLDFLTCADAQCPDGMDGCPDLYVCLGKCPGLQF